MPSGKTSTLGLLPGVTPVKRAKGNTVYAANISLTRCSRTKVFYLGAFDTPEEGHLVWAIHRALLDLHDESFKLQQFTSNRNGGRCFQTTIYKKAKKEIPDHHPFWEEYLREAETRCLDPDSIRGRKG